MSQYDVAGARLIGVQCDLPPLSSTALRSFARIRKGQCDLQAAPHPVNYTFCSIIHYILSSPFCQVMQTGGLSTHIILSSEPHSLGTFFVSPLPYVHSTQLHNCGCVASAKHYRRLRYWNVALQLPSYCFTVYKRGEYPPQKILSPHNKITPSGGFVIFAHLQKFGADRFGLETWFSREGRH